MSNQPAPSITHRHIIPAMVRIPAGWFWMGSDNGQENERPVHKVWVDEFAMGRCQVTNAEYACFLRDTDVSPPPTWSEPNFDHAQQPVASVSWFEAMAYCEWLSKATGERYRLPTEAEWERAARGGKEGTSFPWGEEGPETRPNYQLRWKAGPEKVGEPPTNGYGLFEMCENVHEWCSDWYQADYYANSPEKNPAGPESGSRRSSRGGSWRHHIKISRCSARSSIPPEFRYADYGFRLACDVS